MPALAISATAQGAAFVAYEFTRPIPNPVLTIHMDGEGNGSVRVMRDGMIAPFATCTTINCRIEVPRGASMHIVAVPDDDSTFIGWTQRPMRTPPVLRTLLGDPLAPCLKEDENGKDIAQDVNALLAHGDVRDCGVKISTSIGVGVDFGERPKSVDVALTTPEEHPLPKFPKVKTPLAPKPIEAEKLEEKPLEMALVKPPPPIPLIKPLAPPPPPPPPPPQAATPPPPIPPNMRMVELKDEHVVDKAPVDATHLSDKNRDVDVETRAKDTNLEKEQTGQAVASIKSDDRSSPDIGGPDQSIHQLETETSPSTDRAKPTEHSGDSSTAKGAIVGAGGDNGSNGSGEKKDPGLLAMRDIGGRGSIVDQNGDGKKRGATGAAGIHKQMDFNDYERIVGKESVDKEREIATRKMSAHKGRFESKLAAINSALENFTPDVKPGNQTALKTRAHPFAVFVARMHRRIHELWGFGFLEQLDSRGSTDPLNNFDLWVNIEMSVNPDGTVHKYTVVKTSGKLEFDVAALDTVIQAAPYPETPEAIRSVDGRVYLRWGFYRNWRQCGTFNVEPYILSSIPGGIEPLGEHDAPKGAGDRANQAEDGAALLGSESRPPSVPGKSSKHGAAHAEDEEGGAGPSPGANAGAPAPSAAAASSGTKDPKGVYAANLWLSGLQTGQVDKLVRYSALPFTVGGKQTAQTIGDLTDMFKGLISESGGVRDSKVVDAAEYSKQVGQTVSFGDGGLLLIVQTANSNFGVLFQRGSGGEYHATQLVR